MSILETVFYHKVMLHHQCSYKMQICGAFDSELRPIPNSLGKIGKIYLKIIFMYLTFKYCLQKGTLQDTTREFALLLGHPAVFHSFSYYATYKKTFCSILVVLQKQFNGN